MQEEVEEGEERRENRKKKRRGKRKETSMVLGLLALADLRLVTPLDGLHCALRVALVAREEVETVVLGERGLEALARRARDILLDVVADEHLDVLRKIAPADHQTPVRIERACGTQLRKHKLAEVVCRAVQPVCATSVGEKTKLCVDLQGKKKSTNWSQISPKLNQTVFLPSRPTVGGLM